jgi:hypothetical protein
VILLRVYRGEDHYGSQFARYHPAYEALKIRKNRQPYTAGDWLTLTGQMLAAMTVLFYDSEQFKVGFAGARADGVQNALLAWVHDYEGCGKSKIKRMFFSLTEKEKDEIFKAVVNQGREEGWL